MIGDILLTGIALGGAIVGAAGYALLTRFVSANGKTSTAIQCKTCDISGIDRRLISIEARFGEVQDAINRLSYSVDTISREIACLTAEYGARLAQLEHRDRA